MKLIQKNQWSSITLRREDVESLTELKTLLLNPFYFVKFSKSFIRSFYTKPADKLSLTLKVPSVSQPQIVGAWFDTLLKLFIPLNHQFGFSKSDLEEFINTFNPVDWLPRGHLVGSFFILKDREIKSGELRRSGPGWNSVKLQEILKRVQTFPSYSRKQTEWIKTRYEQGQLDKGPKLLQPEAIEDIKKLIGLIDEKTWQFEYLYMAHQSIKGRIIDVILDDTLIDLKTDASSTLKIDYFDQLTLYFILLRLWQQVYPLPQSIENYQINYTGIYVARFGYLHKIPVSSFIDLEKVERFCQRQS